MRSINLRRQIPSIGFTMLLAFATSTHAGPRSSADYSVTADTADAGGQRSISASYKNDASAGGITGISTASAPDQTAKAGYLGQLTEVLLLQLTATPATVNETESARLGALQLFDDDSLNPLTATQVSWGVLSGPLSGIDGNGIATAATVYQKTAATAQGAYAGATGKLDITVLDSIADNFGSYVADGLADDWQVQYFGLANPLAAPQLDPDGDGQHNRFEFSAGLVPTDPLSRFSLTIAQMPGEPEQMKVIFHPVIAGRSYTVMTSPDPGVAAWTPLAGAISSDNGSQRTVIDTSAAADRKFYVVEIKKP